MTFAPAATQRRGTLWKPIVIGLSIGLLLVPTANSQRALFPGIVCLPLLLLGYRERDDQAFRWWTAYAIGFIAFTVARSYADTTWIQPSMTYALGIDRWIGLGELPTVRLQAGYDARHPGLLAWLAVMIHLAFYYAPPLVGLWLSLTNGPAFRRMVAALLGVYAVSLVLFFLLPTVPPWRAAELGATPPIHRVVEDTLYAGLYEYGTHVAGGNDYAAMPSVHLAVTSVLGLAIGWRIALLATLAMAWSLVFAGEHYVIDVIAGLAIALGIWPLTRRFA